ncbi:MAG: DMT family transporter [Actinobacteria bacterium]|nr:DMT family transporter [Actinomycetota bacterium]
MTTTPRLGVSLVSVAVAAGAVVAGLFADGVGLSTSGRHAPSWPRLVGAALIVAAVLVSASSRHVGGNAGDFALAAVGGFALGCQHPINSRLGRALGEPSFAVVVSFVIGAAATVAFALRHWPTGDWPLNPALYAGGVIAAAYVFAAIRIVGRIGALRLSLATLAGQLVGAALLDGLAPINGRKLTTAGMIGVGIAVAGVVISSLTKSRTPSMD